MNIMLYALYGWLAFITLVYLYMWYDSREHHFNIIETLTSIKDTFMQDE